MLQEGKLKLAVARVIKPHGIKGELSAELTDYAEPEQDFAPGACVIAEIDGLDVPFFIGAARARGANSVLLTIDGIGSETEAQALAGHTLYIYADPEEVDGDDLTAGHLIGYEITDADSGAAVGRVADLTELTPGSWYFALEGSGKLIPAVDEMILSVDPEARRIEMRLPQGLLEL